MSLTFVNELPAVKRGRPRLYGDVAEGLRARPGVWAVWPNKIPPGRAGFDLAANIRFGRLRSFTRGKFEAAIRDGQLFVRYVGDGS